MRVTLPLSLLVLATTLACGDKPSTTVTDSGGTGDEPGTGDPSGSSGSASSGDSASPTSGSMSATETTNAVTGEPDTMTSGFETTSGTISGTATVTGEPDTMSSGFETTSGTISGTATETTNAVTGETTLETSTSTTGGTTEPIPPASCEGSDPSQLEDVEIISYTDGQIDPDSADPGLIYVRISEQKFICADPHHKLACGGEWELSIRIPTEFQAPGLYQLWLGDVFAFGLENGGFPDENLCDGGGSMAKGTLEILAIDDLSVTGRLCGVTWSGLDNSFALDGGFVAPRCP